MNQALRVFCSIGLPAEVRERAVAHIARLREKFPRVRVGWERAEKLHITLKFLGEIEMHRLDALNRAAERAASNTDSFALSIETAGAFPPHGLARALWLGVNDATGALTKLQCRLEEDCALENFARDHRSFQPHLTIARIRAPEQARELAVSHRALGFTAESFVINEMVIMRSDLQSHGSKYTEISAHSFLL
ncbi:MAG: RNA 2',3'-cyclic phosphodiesterase [Pyrinomonadaceae bacterium]